MLERVLRQFRQVARAGSRLAISVSRSGTDREARSRFQALVAALGEPARSALEAGGATELLAHTGWQVIAADDANDPDVAARRERLRAAGLLTATARPAPTASARRRAPCPAPGNHPASASRLSSPRDLSPCPPCCPRRSSRSRSSSTTRPNTASRTAPRTMGPLSRVTGPGWYRWPCSRTACGSSPTSPSPSASSKPWPAPRPTWTACAAGVTSPSTAPPRRSTMAARAAAPSCAPPPGACGPGNLAALARPYRAALAGALGADQIARLRHSPAKR